MAGLRWDGAPTPLCAEQGRYAKKRFELAKSAYAYERGEAGVTGMQSINNQHKPPLLTLVQRRGG